MKTELLPAHLHLLLDAIREYQQMFDGDTPHISDLATALETKENTIRGYLVILKRCGFIAYTRVDKIMILKHSEPELDSESPLEKKVRELEAQLNSLRNRVERMDSKIPKLYC